MEFSEAQLASLGEALEAVASGQGRFDMAVMQRLANRRFRLLLFDRDGLPGSSLPLSTRTDRGSCELLTLHGPHFQDRYGVAHAAVSALHNHGVPVQAVGCTGSSICLVVPAQTGDVAARALTDVFIVPKV